MDELRKRAEEILGKPLPPEGSPEYVSALAVIARSDPALARALAQGRQADPKALKRLEKQAEAALKAEARRATLRQRLQALRERFFFRRLSLGGKRLSVPRKPVWLLVILLLVGGGLWMAWSMTSAPQKKSSPLAAGLVSATQASSMSDEELVAQAEKALGRKLSGEPTARDLQELRKLQPNLAQELEKRMNAKAQKAAGEGAAKAAMTPDAGAGNPVFSALQQVPPGSEGRAQQAQAGQASPSATPPPPEAVPPVPPPPTAPGGSGSGQEENLITIAERPPSKPLLVGAEDQTPSASSGGQAQGGQGGGQAGAGGRSGMILVERSISPSGMVRAEGARTAPPLFVQEKGSGTPRGLVLAERASAQPLVVEPRPQAQQAGAAQPRGWAVLAEAQPRSAQAPAPGGATPSSSMAVPPPPSFQPQASTSSPGSQALPGPQASSPLPSGGTTPLGQAAGPSGAPAGAPFQAAPSASQASGPGASGQAPQAAPGQAPQAPALPYTPGRFYTARLQVELVVPEGGSVPVVLEGADGGIWMGTAKLTPLGRVQVDLDQVYRNGVGYRVRAMAYENNQLGLSASIREEAPSLAQDLLRAAAAGFSKYTEYLAKQTSVVQLPGGGVAQTQQAPPLEYVLLGEAGKLFSVPEGRQSLVRIAQVPAGKVVQVMLLGTQ